MDYPSLVKIEWSDRICKRILLVILSAFLLTTMIFGLFVWWEYFEFLLSPSPYPEPKYDSHLTEESKLEPFSLLFPENERTVVYWIEGELLYFRESEINVKVVRIDTGEWTDEKP